MNDTTVPVNIKYTLNDDISVIAMVANGFGVSIMPELILRNVAIHLAIKALHPTQYRTIGIASLPLSTVSTVTKAFLKYIINNETLFK